MSLLLLGNFPVAPSASFHEARHGHQKGCIAAEFEKKNVTTLVSIRHVRVQKHVVSGVPYAIILFKNVIYAVKIG